MRNGNNKESTDIFLNKKWNTWCIIYLYPRLDPSIYNKYTHYCSRWMIILIVNRMGGNDNTLTSVMKHMLIYHFAVIMISIFRD